MAFSQVEGYKEIPQRLRLAELSPTARTKVWDVFFHKLDAGELDPLERVEYQEISVDEHEIDPALCPLDSRSTEILRAKHTDHDNLGMAYNDIEVSLGGGLKTTSVQSPKWNLNGLRTHSLQSERGGFGSGPKPRVRRRRSRRAPR